MKKNLSFSRLAYIIFALLLLTSASTFAASGDLDADFGSGGKVITPIGSDDSGNAVAIQPDGKIVAVGWATISGSGIDFALARYNFNGSLDTTFGINGKVTTSVGNGSIGDYGYSVVIQSDGKILVAGESGNNPNIKFALVRYNPNGSLDTTFGIGGKVTTAVGSVNNSGANALFLQTDGKIVAVGYAQDASFNSSFAAVRYNADGNIDTSFGTNGKVITPTGNALSVAAQTDGKFILAGSSNNDFALVRYISNGVIDPSFGTNGKVITTFANSSFVRGKDIAIQADGKILMTGNVFRAAGNNFTTVRYNSNGSLDTSFGAGGIVTTTVSSSSSSNTLAVQTNGKIIVAGDSSRNFAVARYNSNGTLDTGFGTNGTVTTPANNGEIRDVAVQADGKIVVVGTQEGISLLDGGAEFIIAARYLGDAVISRRASFDFDGDNKSDISVYRPSSGVWYFLNSNTGFTQILPFGTATDKLVPADYDGDGRTDVAVYRPSTGIWYIIRSSAGFLITQPFGGASGDVPIPSDFDGDGRAELVIYRPSNGTWYVLNPANNNFTVQQFGIPEDKAVPADFDGDGRADFAVYRPSNGIWYLLRSRDGFTGIQFGQLAEDRPIVGDYDGDGRADEAIFRPSTGVWYLLRSRDGFRAFAFGEQAGDQPAPADYDGDGKTDNAIYRPSTGVWFIQSSQTGTTTGTQFGTAEDKPLPNSFVP